MPRKADTDGTILALASQTTLRLMCVEPKAYGSLK
jgi:hypothetical protein